MRATSPPPPATAALLLAAVALAVLGGCTRNPTKKEARAYYHQHKATLDSIDQRVRSAVGRLPPVHHESYPQAVQRFRREVLYPLLVRGVIGVKITYVVGAKKHRHTLARLGLTPGRVFRGYVPPAKGIRIEGRHVGHGRFRTEYQAPDGTPLGDRKRRPGLHVAWFFQRDDVRYRVEVVALVSHDPGAAWHAGWRPPAK